MNRYWDNEGLYEAEAAQLQELVPVAGNCETLKGEIWRAATKIYHDYYNNGFGNFWAEAASFLMDNIRLEKSVKNILLEHANGNIANGDYEEEMEMMIDATIAQLQHMKDRPNEVDMWDYKSYNYTFDEEWAEEDEDEDFEDA